MKSDIAITLVGIFGVTLLFSFNTYPVYGPLSDPKLDDRGFDNLSTESNQMPNWFKNNAKWWKDGLISDQDIVNAIENLIENNIIKVDLPSKPVITSNTSEKNQSIPSFVKDVFGFWSNDLVSDSEIGNSLQYLIKEDIIRSEKIAEKKKMLEPISDEITYPDILGVFYGAQKYNEFIASKIIETNSGKITREEAQQTMGKLSEFVQNARERAIRNGVTEESLKEREISRIVDDFSLNEKIQNDFDSLIRNEPGFQEKYKEIESKINWDDARHYYYSGQFLENGKQVLPTVLDFWHMGYANGNASILLGQILEEEGKNIEFNQRKKPEPEKLEPVEGINSVLDDIEPIKGIPGFTPVKKVTATVEWVPRSDGTCTVPSCGHLMYQFWYDDKTKPTNVSYVIREGKYNNVLSRDNPIVQVNCGLNGRTMTLSNVIITSDPNAVFAEKKLPYVLNLPCEGENNVNTDVEEDSESTMDSDGDGLSDTEERKIFFTDPFSIDTDFDWIDDGYELDNGLDPLNWDTDGDGLEDGIDVNPTEYSDKAYDLSENGSHLTAVVTDRGGNQVEIIKYGQNGQSFLITAIEGNGEHKNTVTIVVLDIELVVEVGTSFEATFG